MEEMSKASFNVLYDGPALASSEMDVRELAPALLSLGALLDEANETINSGKAKVAVKVKASFKTGCFGIELDVTQSFLQQMNIIFANDKVATAKQLLEWLGLLVGTSAIAAGSVKGLIGLLKWLKGKPLTKVVLLDNGLVRVEVDNKSIELEKEIIDLYRQTKLRNALEGVLKPLESEGIDEFAVTDKGQKNRFLIISGNEVEYFHTPETQPELLSEQDLEINLQLVNIAFKEENKWRFSDGTNSFYAVVADQSFLDKVRRNEAFASGDILKAKIRRTQYLAGDSMKTEYTVLNVIEHRRASTQLPLEYEKEVKGKPKPGKP